MSLIEVMNQSIVRSKRSRTQIALALGYKTGAPMQRILNDNDDGYSLPIERVAPFCAAVGGHDLIEAICQQCGGHFVADANLKSGTIDLMAAIGRLAGLSGDVVEALIADAVDDGELNRPGTKRMLQTAKKVFTELLARAK